MDALHINVIVLTVVFSLVALVFAVLLYRGRSEATKLSLPVLSGTGLASKAPVRIAINPLQDISFEDSLQPEILAEATSRNVRGTMLANYGADAASAALQITSEHRGGLVVTFNKQVYRLVHTADGRYLTESRLPSGRFGEIAHFDKFGTWLNNFSHASAAVVAVAHLISNADMSKRLGQVQQNTEKLLDYRQIDSMADIRTAYEALREEMGRAEPRREVIARHRDTIRLNRHRLFGEAQSDVSKMNSLLRFNHATARKVEQRVKTRSFNQRKQELTDVMIKLHKASYCFQLEALAAPFCDSEQDQLILRGEAATAWRKLALEITPLEDEIREHDQCAKQLLAVAKIMRSMA